MMNDEQIVGLVTKAFEDQARPEHFTDYRHCCECAEHDALLASRDLESLRLDDVNNGGWDPMCFATADGFRYYLPALVRLALESAKLEREWYLPQLLFHLIGDGPRNRRVEACSQPQKRAIAAFLWQVLESRIELISSYGIEEEVRRAIEIWSDQGD
jgi:hypothetical protein